MQRSTDENSSGKGHGGCVCLESQHLGSEGRRIILRELEFSLGSIRLCLSSERGTGVGREDMGIIASALNT